MKTPIVKGGQLMAPIRGRSSEGAVFQNVPGPTIDPTPKDLQFADRSLMSRSDLMPSTEEAKAISPSEMVFDLLRDNYRLADSTPFLKLGTVSVGLTELSVVSFTIPIGMKGVLKFFGQGAKTSLAFDHVTWRLMRNGTPIADLGAFTFQLGSISAPYGTTERLSNADLIELRAISDVAGPYEIYGLLSGWYWSL